LDNKLVVLKDEEQIKNRNLPHNRLFYECCIWLFHVLETENIDLNEFFDITRIEEIINNIDEFDEIFSTENSHFSKNVIRRYSYTLSLVKNWIDFDTQVYLGNSKQFRERYKKLTETKTAKEDQFTHYKSN